MDVLTRIEFHSKVAPGAVATFRRASATSRARFLDTLAESRVRIRDLYRQRKPLDDEFQAERSRAMAEAKIEVDQLIEAEGITRADAEARVTVKTNFPDDKFLEWSDLTDEITRLERQSGGWGTLRSLLVSIEGYTLGGKTPTAEELIAEAPCELTDELVTAANEIASLSPTERGESPWPGTSAQAAAGPKSDTTAAAAESTPASA
ncbi:MAG: hypothetical protein ABFD60_11315 [Bryobacteraceae bacterium]